jgi:hypothetical protein
MDTLGNQERLRKKEKPELWQGTRWVGVRRRVPVKLPLQTGSDLRGDTSAEKKKKRAG